MRAKGLLSTYTGKLILINVIAFFIFFIFLGTFGEQIISKTALQPSIFMAGQNLWTLLTSMFMHAGIGHLLANMISLFFIGLFVEKLIGSRRFLIFYFGAGIFAGLFYAVMSFFFGNSALGAKIFGAPTIPAMGASGAIFGLLGLLAVLTPLNKIYLIAGPLIAIILQSTLAAMFPTSQLISSLNIFVTIYFIFAIYAIFSFNPKMRRLALPIEMHLWILPIIAIVPLVIIGLFISLPIGNAAHFGGLLVGLAYGFYLRKKYPRKTARISRHFSN